MPTIAELCGVKLLDADIDGKSLVPVIRSAAAPTPHDGTAMAGRAAAPQWAVRQGDWKLIGNVVDSSGGLLSAEEKKLFLSNLAIDPSENHSLAREHPEVVERLRELRRRWINAQNKPLPARLSQDRLGNEK